MGESFGNYKIGNDAEIMNFISSANIACGYHAGDPMVMANTIKLALEHHVAVGAHPGYPDLQGFGRRNMNLSPNELYAYVLYQVGALKSMTEAQGGKLRHVKPHGAMYNQAAVNEEYAVAISRAVLDIDPELIVVCPANSPMYDVAKHLGAKVASEAFADRAYTDAGQLVPRSSEGAVIHDSEVAITRMMNLLKTGEIESINGNSIKLQADTICIHGDNKEALEFAHLLHKSILDSDIELKPMGL